MMTSEVIEPRELLATQDVNYSGEYEIINSK